MFDVDIDDDDDDDDKTMSPSTFHFDSSIQQLFDSFTFLCACARVCVCVKIYLKTLKRKDRIKRSDSSQTIINVRFSSCDWSTH